MKRRQGEPMRAPFLPREARSGILPGLERPRGGALPGREGPPALASGPAQPRKDGPWVGRRGRAGRLGPPRATCEEAAARAEEEGGGAGGAPGIGKRPGLERDATTMEGGTGSGPGMANERVKNLQNEVEGVKNIMTQNVERILARGENLDHLRNKTEDLEATSEHFKTTSQKVARKYWWKNVKMIAIICVIAAIILILIILLATGVIPS